MEDKFQKKFFKPVFPQLEPLEEAEQIRLKSLRDFFKELDEVCIAYSGGVDSSLVASIAHEQLNSRAFAITGVSPSLSPTLLKEAKEQAAWIGIRHEECKTKELLNPNYSNNPNDRCFTCKQELHKNIKEITKSARGCLILDGVNLDDLAEYRPGINAARLAGVRSPLAELKIGKTSIRQISYALAFR